MAYRIEIISTIQDARAEVRKRKLQKGRFSKKIEDLWIHDVYTIDKNLSQKQITTVADMLCNPIIQKPVFYSEKKKTIPLPFKIFTFAFEIGFLPGVTDNIATTTKEAIEDILHISFLPEEGVYSSQIMFVRGNLSQKDMYVLADSLINPLIQRVHIKSFGQYRKDQGMDIVIPKVHLQKKPTVTVVDILTVSNTELKKIGEEGIKNKNGSTRGPLALHLLFMKAIQTYFKKQGRNPTDIELESLAQTWSEHCKHTIFADPIDDIEDGLFQHYIKRATEEIRKKLKKNDFCVSVFQDNSGAIVFDKDFLITHKVETHNSPSALDPFGGAITGIVGVNRDAIGFGQGAKPIINTYGFCFADARIETPLYQDVHLKNKMLSPKRIMEGVIEGINSGGNCSGIPTPQGFIFFDARFQGKPLVFAGTVGLIPKRIKRKSAWKKKAQKGDYIVMVGGRVGQDGIHGATFSSQALDMVSPATAVQIGDPITQKKLSDVLIKEARDYKLYTSITDNGAGGLSSSVGEMAKQSGGCRVILNNIPLKYPGLDPWQIWISESQERMTLAVPKTKWRKLHNLLTQHGVEGTVIGEFTDSGKCIVEYKGKKIMDIDMEFLHDGLPKRPMQTILPQPHVKTLSIPKPKNITHLLHEMLSRLNIASFEFISQQYDHEVQGGSVLKPLQGRGRINGDATVIQPVLNSQRGVVLSQGIYPTYSEIDPYHMAACAIDTAVRNAITAGGSIRHLALLDNFCWCSSNDPKRLGQLKRAVQACYDYATRYATPFISGKDSMFNDFQGYDKQGNPIHIAIPPTLLISSIGVVADIKNVVSLDVKYPGDLVYIVGETHDELGGSEYINASFTVPKVEALKNKKLYETYETCVQNKLVASAISITRGGLGIALAKTAMGGMLGIDISLKHLPGKTTRDDFALFSESQGRIVVTINPSNKAMFENIMKGTPFSQIGIVTKKPDVVIRGIHNTRIVQTTVEKMLESYKKTFKNY